MIVRAVHGGDKLNFVFVSALILTIVLWMDERMNQGEDRGRIFKEGSIKFHPHVFADGYELVIHPFTSCGLERV